MLKRTIVTTLTTGALLFSAFVTPVFAATDLTISGNGAGSINTTSVTNDSNTTVVQSNVAKISNDVNTTTETGNNTANANTGGDTTILTGNATNDTSVSTTANLNKADVSGCGTCTGDETVKISGNGANSINTADLQSNKQTAVFQDNRAKIYNYVDAHASTGNNDASLNTGGAVTVGTGNAATNVEVKNKANANIAKIGDSNGGNGGSLGALIDGNGAGSINAVNLTSNPSTIVTQSNSAWIKNHIHANAETGRNTANANTAGDVIIHTGSAKQNVDVENKVNFNAADLGCGCITDVTAKISGNGADSINQIVARLGGENAVFQGGGGSGLDSVNGFHGAGNFAWLKNSVGGHVETGENNASINTGIPADGVFLATGNAESTTTVKNNSNVNLVGPLSGLTLPNGSFNLSFDFDLGALLGFLHFV